MKLRSFFQKGKATGGTGSIFRGMLTLALGSGSARLISVATIPVLSRIYTPDDYGVLSVFTALTAIIAPLLAMRYVIALPLPRRDSMGINLFALCILSLITTSIIFSSALFIFGETLLELLSMESLIPYRWLIVICFVGTAVYEIMTSWALRHRAYKHIAKTQFTQSSFGALTKVGLGLLSLKPLGLLIGQTVSVAAGSGNLIRGYRDELYENSRYISLKNIKRAARAYWKYPAYRLPAQFLQDFSMRSPMLFVAARFDAASTGQFGMAVMSLSIPMNLVGQTLGRAFLAEVATVGRSNPGKIEEMTYGVLKRLAPIAIFFGASIYFFSPWVFVKLLGAQWDLAGELGSAMAFYIMTQLLSAPLMNILSVLDKNGVHLTFTISRFILVILVFTISKYLSLGILATILIYSLALSVQRTGQVITILRVLRKERIRRTTQRATDA